MEASSTATREHRLRWTLGTLHLLVIAAFTWARIVRDGAFLSRVTVEWVPYLTVAVLAATALLTPVIGRLTRGVNPLQAFARVAIVTGASLLVWELVLGDESPLAAAVLYVWVGAYGPLLVAQFWLVVHAELDAEQARRHIGSIGALGITGGAIAGLLVTLLAGALTFDEWLGLTAFLHLGAGAMALALVPAATAAPAAAQRPPSPRTTRAREVLRSAGYARLLATVLLLAAGAGAFVDYQFKLALQQRSTDAAALGQWLGLFNVAVNVIALVVQLPAAFLLARFGSRLLALALPVGVLAGAAGGLVLPGVWPPVLTRLWENAARHSLARTAQEFFFLPFQGEHRAAMKRAAEGFLMRGGEVLASLALVLLAELHRADSWHVALFTVLTAGAWVLALGWLGGAYGPALSQSLDQLLRPGRVEPPSPPDRAVAVPELVTLLRSQDDRHVVFALDELASADPDRARREARTLLAHGSPDVRRRARRELATRGASPQAPVVTTPWLALRPLVDALRSGDETKAREACEQVVANGDRHAVPALLDALAGASRSLARDTLVRLGDAISGSLGDTLVDPRMPMRVRYDVARVLGQMGTPAALAQLQRLPRTAPRLLRSLALHGLDAARKHDRPVALDEALVREDIDADLREFDQRLAQRAALTAASDGRDLALLPRALDEVIASLREHVFRRLALLYPASEMLRAHRGLTSGDERIRAFAFEYLEATLVPDDRDRIMPVLRRAEPSAPRPLLELLEELARDHDAWIATLAVHAIGLVQARELRQVVEMAAKGDPVRQETARWALARL